MFPRSAHVEEFGEGDGSSFVDAAMSRIIVSIGEEKQVEICDGLLYLLSSIRFSADKRYWYDLTPQ